MQKYQMFIGGEWVDAKNKATRSVVDPGTNEIIATVPESTKEDVALAIDVAREAFDRGTWRKTTALDRGKFLFKIADLIRRDFKKLAELAVLNC